MNQLLAELFNENHNLLGKHIQDYPYPWDILPNLNQLILELQNKLAANPDYYVLDDGILCHKTASIHPRSTLIGPCIIDEACEIRPNAFIRENVILGRHNVIGNSTEIKNSILFDHVQVPHFNYIGDSILGSYVHLGAGAILSNKKFDGTPIKIGSITTSLHKMGALIGHHTEIGCNAVISPGTIISPNCWIYPGCCLKQNLPPNTIYKAENQIIPKKD